MLTDMQCKTDLSYALCLHWNSSNLDIGQHNRDSLGLNSQLHACSPCGFSEDAKAYRMAKFGLLLHIKMQVAPYAKELWLFSRCSQLSQREKLTQLMHIWAGICLRKVTFVCFFSLLRLFFTLKFAVDPGEEKKIKKNILHHLCNC